MRYIDVLLHGYIYILFNIYIYTYCLMFVVFKFCSLRLVFLLLLVSLFHLLSLRWNIQLHIDLNINTHTCVCWCPCLFTARYKYKSKHEGNFKWHVCLFCLSHIQFGGQPKTIQDRCDTTPRGKTFVDLFLCKGPVYVVVVHRCSHQHGLMCNYV